MHSEIYASPDFAMVDVTLQPGESLVAESGAMVGMTTNIQLKTAARGGVLAGLKRKLLGGESFFINTFTAVNTPGMVHIAPAVPGDVMRQNLNNETLMIQSSCFLASAPTVNLDTKWGGAKGFFSGTGMFLLKASGVGDLYISSYGAVHPVQVQGKYIVDTGHIVAFQDSLTYSIRKVGGLKSLFFSGEGLVCEFSGNGMLWLQTRNASSFASWIHPFRPVKAKSN
ncbi:MAG TPA: TIGR00266 family protein [Myxococcota bacterium]|jgi:uncharacterized protein (TIGR00266 family)|nr:TIGR00266 family protein [Myxococcota bacterium]